MNGVQDAMRLSDKKASHEGLWVSDLHQHTAWAGTMLRFRRSRRIREAWPVQQEQSLSTRPSTTPFGVQRKLARQRVAHHWADLQRWRSKTLQIRALGAYRHQSAEAFAAGDDQLAALRSEIDQARRAFLIEMDDIRDMPAVVDYLGALDRLLK